MKLYSFWRRSDLGGWCRCLSGGGLACRGGLAPELADGRPIGCLERPQWVELRAWRRRIGVVPTWWEYRLCGGRVEWRRFYLFSTTWMPSTRVEARYNLRWTVEVFHRVAKKELGLEAFHPRTPLGIVNWVAIVFLTYAVLQDPPRTWLERKQRLAP